jgi:hypothetical protein
VDKKTRRTFGASLLAIAGSISAAGVAAPFTPGNLVVYRVGNGSTTLSQNGNHVFLDEYTTAGALVQSLAMPSAASGSDKPIVASGTATVDGFLSRSVDGTCLAVPGYGRDLPSSGSGLGNLVSGSMPAGGPVPRTIARVTGAGTIDSTTALTDTSVGDNFRSVATVDCESYWTAGGAGSAGGLQYALRGATASTALNGTPTPFRVVTIVDGQLYTSAANATGGFTFRGVNTVGTGLPTSGTPNITRLPGFQSSTPANTTSPNGYFFADLDGSPGVDTLYVADDQSAGLTKFSLVAGTWTVNGVIGGDTDDYRNVTGSVSGGTVTLYIVRGSNQLVTLTDASGYNGAFSGTPTVVATAGTNQAFRNVVWAPVLSATPLVSGGGGTVSPATPQAVAAGAQVDFTLTPDAGHDITAEGTCGGSFTSANVYRTAPVTASCYVQFAFPQIQTYTVTSSGGDHGTIDPVGEQVVTGGTILTFAVTADSGYKASVGGSCGGTLSGTTYTTTPIGATCTVEAAFEPLPVYAITPSTTPHGAVTPAGVQSVQEGQTIAFTVTPDEGYHGAMRGTCPGSWTDPTTYTVGPVTGPCSVQATFAQKLVLFVGNSYTFGRVDPVMSYNTANVTDLTYAMWVSNPSGSNEDEPHPWGGIPGVFKKMIEQVGLDWDVSISARNAASLKGHYLNTNPAGWDLRGNLASQPYTTVVLQDLSDEPLPAGRGFNADLTSFNTYADKLADWVHVGDDSVPNNVNARAAADVYLYSTWARPDMIAPNGSNEHGMYYNEAEGLELMTAHLHDAYFGKFASYPHYKAVNPVGDAFLIAVQAGFAMRDPYVPEAGKINLWHTDYFHPSKYGSYLSALVHFAMLTGIDPMTLGAGEQSAADLGISPDDAEDLQLAAKLATVPKAPHLVTYSPGDGSVTIHFNPPSNVGGLAITSYTVGCWVGDFATPPTPITVTGVASPITVTGLVNGGTYVCGVTTSNSVGVSAYSNTVSFVLGETIPPAVKNDFNGDGRSDLVFFHADGRIAIWTMDGLTRTDGGDILGAGSGWHVAATGDLDGDGRTDIVWRHDDGRVATWVMDGLVPSATAEVLAAGQGWSVVSTADFDGDGKADILWQGSGGAQAIWLMDGATMREGAAISTAAIGPLPEIWTGDLNGDGKADLVFNQSDGSVWVWLMDGLTVTSKTRILSAGSGWSVARSADFDGDGKDDLLWYRQADGHVAIWLMDGFAPQWSAEIFGGEAGWVPYPADFDGDGKSDIYFQHSDGRAAIWLMDGITPVQTTQILNAGDWRAQATNDLNGDGKADILWRNLSDGRIAVWLMDGATVSSGGDILGGGSGWSVAGP